MTFYTRACCIALVLSYAARRRPLCRVYIVTNAFYFKNQSIDIGKWTVYSRVRPIDNTYLLSLEIEWAHTRKCSVETYLQLFFRNGYKIGCIQRLDITLGDYKTLSDRS